MKNTLLNYAGCLFAAVFALLLCFSVTSCSSGDDEENAGQDGSAEEAVYPLVGSEWTASYYTGDPEGEYVSHKVLLTFVNSTRAEEKDTYTVYTPATAGGHEQRQGESLKVYDYVLDGDKVVLTDTEGGGSRTLTIVGGNMTSDTEPAFYTLIKAGSASVGTMPRRIITPTLTTRRL